MDKLNALKIAASTLAASAAIMTGANADNGQKAAASAAQAEMMQVASNAAAIARKAIASGKGALAAQHAEKAVAAMPSDAGYRLLLGEAYLVAGRFASAETAFNDVLTLDPAHAKAGLKLALALAAQGKQPEALAALDAHRDKLNVADYGLALALAGDPSAAVQVLMPAARAPDATPKVRQNLAFALAMTNDWAMARTVASQDLSGEALHQRIAQWAMLARPQTAADQVAGILGVKPAFDPGQPQALALAPVVDQPQTQLAAAEMPATTSEIEAAAPAVSVALAAEAPVAASPVDRIAEIENVAAAQAVPQAVNGVVFGPRQEIVQRIPERSADARIIRAPSKPMKQQVVPAKRTAQVEAPSAKQAVIAKRTAQVDAPVTKPVESGRFAVQLGAYGSLKRAEKGWNSVANRIASLREYDPQTARVRVSSGSFYRLSVTGFTSREVAGQVCSRIKASGGDCFIRAVAGDSSLQMALRRNSGGSRIAAARR